MQGETIDYDRAHQVIMDAIGWSGDWDRGAQLLCVPMVAYINRLRNIHNNGYQISPDGSKAAPTHKDIARAKNRAHSAWFWEAINAERVAADWGDDFHSPSLDVNGSAVEQISEAASMCDGGLDQIRADLRERIARNLDEAGGVAKIKEHIISASIGLGCLRALIMLDYQGATTPIDLEEAIVEGQTPLVFL